ncbi:DUF3871 family protein [uncultured Chryseobacterium sp.]|uniref:DUF3871 family protein n=1 Tax=uncultured Chryseobacterium sp. TaxID=259322 RepID=UPI0025E3F713|nr:DUF3871 family protein [uncultured Chryseobacterium sp.]
MDTLRHIKPATLEQAFDLRPVSNTLIEMLPGDDTYISAPDNVQIQSKPLQTQTEYAHKPFIEANTQEVHLQNLKNECIIPVFSKDNEKTISHQEFIEISQNCIANVFPNHYYQ